MTDMTEQNAAMKPPVAKREPQRREFHGDIFEDDYEWMRNKESAEVQDYVASQNTYCEARMSHLAGLRHTLFEELKAHVEETDMSVPTRINGYWYFTRTQQGKQYGVQCRMPVRGADDWDPPVVDPQGAPGSMPGEQVVFDANVESEGHDFFRLGGMDLSHDGRWVLYGVDVSGDERYDFRIRDLDATLEQGRPVELPELFKGIGGACFTPDGKWVFWTEVDDSWRPCAIWRHQVGTPVESDVCVYRETDERFWVGAGISFDERSIVIGTGSKTSTEVLMLPVATPEGEFQAFIPRKEDVEYDVSFACFEGAGENGEDVPLAVVYHNANNPNFEIDVIDMRAHKPPYRLGEGVCVAAGSPYGCERGDMGRPITEAYFNPLNPAILQGAHGLGIEGIALHRYFVTLSYRSDGQPHVAYTTKQAAAADFLAGRPWRFTELLPPPLENDWDMVAADRSDSTGDHGERLWTDDTAADAVADASVAVPQDHTSSFDGASDDHLPGETRRLYNIGTGGNPSYDAPRMRYSFASYTRPGELHEIDPATGRDTLLKRATVLGDFDPRDYMERRVWITARDGERIPVSLVWRRDFPAQDSPMFITGYGAYEISSDPGFSVARLSMLDRGVLYAVPHIRGGGELGRAWYEQGRRLNKKHTFEDFVDATRALQTAHLADSRRTVANGGSAGGLLMGAVANMAPECFAGIEADVPFVDALTSILNPDLPLTVTEWDEWGDPLHDSRVYEYMKSYTPYENVPVPVVESAADAAEIEDAAGATAVAEAVSASKNAVDFPRIFITTSMNDTRVLYVEPLKWLARLQSAGVDAVAKIEVEAGHGGLSGRYKQWEEVSYENAWCLAVMHITR
ncbi:oligopeptidase B [Bifidobacterium saguini DSM 23967]|uniref:Oligopeptidase B n=2 Tax=Bifidobacterium saguini TaxID=762210 RepID=A0A087D935_9BIFI|nr:S9 family peptidase [Bifidobacterium saguini]KFI92035.1 oligopeptidase B [Bifidobacterium saguini DSM 23967]QTB90268.1 S9 family peptidase [Bifidobacterium saguini]